MAEGCSCQFLPVPGHQQEIYRNPLCWCGWDTCKCWYLVPPVGI